jgi:hypothetical protein
VVVGDRLDGERGEPGCGGLGGAEPGGGRDLVEHPHDLGTQRAGEGPPAAGGVLAGNAALLVRGGAERQVGVQAVHA